MRVISQDGTLDFPYELSTVRVYNEIISMGMCKDDSCRSIIARYSTEEKALKAMEMLREQYEQLVVFKVLASGAAEDMGKSFNNDELLEHYRAYREMNVFQFPKDEEVEV